jgi:YVTN family beta-propeller protein
VAISSDSQTAYVADTDSNTVTVLNLATGATTATVTVGNAPAAIAISPDGAHVYAVNAEDDTIVDIDTATDTVGATGSTGSVPVGLALSPDGTIAYVANQGDLTLSVIQVAQAVPTTPVVTAVSPATGPAAGGASVTITGTNLTGATAITFGPGNPAATFSCTSDTSCTATAPAAAAGTVDVQVTTPGGTSPTTSGDQYTYTRTAPTLTWTSPAPITFGTALSGTQLDAHANVAGTFTYTPAAGTVLQPGTQTLTATFTPTNTADYTTGTITTQITVGFTQACLTTAHNGPLTVTSGQAFCIGAGGTVNGPVSIQAGAALYSTQGKIAGPVNATGATAFTLCSSTFNGPLTLTGSTGPVLIGAAGCAGNTIAGPVIIDNGTGGVSFVGNHVSGPVTITGNTGGFTYTGNTVTGPVNTNNNH